MLHLVLSCAREGRLKFITVCLLNKVKIQSFFIYFFSFFLFLPFSFETLITLVGLLKSWRCIFLSRLETSYETTKQDGVGEGRVINLHNIFSERTWVNSYHYRLQLRNSMRKGEKKNQLKTKQSNIKIKKCLHNLDTAEEHNTE